MRAAALGVEKSAQGYARAQSLARACPSPARDSARKRLSFVRSSTFSRVAAAIAFVHPVEPCGERRGFGLLRLTRLALLAQDGGDLAV